MKIALTGSTGLIGSRFVDLLQNKYDITELKASDRFNIVDKDSVFTILEKENPSIIIHFAAKTNVDQCEIDKDKDIEKLISLGLLKDNLLNIDKIDYKNWIDDVTAFSVNVVGTKNIADYAFQNKIKTILISTDLIFSGENEFYEEDDLPSPISWYGQTKYYGEQIIQNLNNYIITRLAYPYGYPNQIKKDFIWGIIDILKSKGETKLVYDQIITPTFIDDIVYGLEFLINKNSNGIYHLVGDSFISPYEIGLLIADLLSIDRNIINKISKDDYFKDRAKRPFKLRIKNDKLEKLGFRTKTIKEGLELIKKFL